MQSYPNGAKLEKVPLVMTLSFMNNMTHSMTHKLVNKIANMFTTLACLIITNRTLKL